MEKKYIRDVKIGTKIKVPVDDNGMFTYDYDGVLLGKKQYIVATLVEPGVIAWKDDQRVKVRQSYSVQKISGSIYEKLKTNLDSYVPISSGVPCIIISPKQKTTTNFLFAALGAGVVMNGLVKMSSNKAVDSKLREMSK